MRMTANWIVLRWHAYRVVADQPDQDSSARTCLPETHGSGSRFPASYKDSLDFDPYRLDSDEW